MMRIIRINEQQHDLASDAHHPRRLPALDCAGSQPAGLSIDMPFRQPARIAASLALPLPPASLAAAFPPVLACHAAHLANRESADAPIDTRPVNRRRKLWELPADFHWPLIGACFDSDELRELVAKHLAIARQHSDFVLHIMVADACSARSPLPELIQKQLDQRHAADIRQFGAAETTDTVKTCWQAALHNGTRIPGALWAAWTHPACDESLEHEIHGDIHMVQLRLAHRERHQAIALQELRAAHRRVIEELETSKLAAQSLQQARSTEKQALSGELTQLRAAIAGRDNEIRTLKRQLQALQHAAPLLSEQHTAIWRAEHAENRLAECQARQAQLEEELSRLRLAASRRPLAISAESQPKAATARDNLAGKCVLCVGGRSSAVNSYRQAVEARGGRFLHHDGGQEESPHRINAALSAADLVICQAGCISHNAYWRVKSQCKRSGKPCLFVSNPGVSSFERLVSDACGTESPA